jgi:hypothetical protein
MNVLDLLPIELKDFEADYGADATLLLKVGILLAHSREQASDSAEQIMTHDQALNLLYKHFKCNDVDNAIIINHLQIAYDHKGGW